MVILSNFDFGGGVGKQSYPWAEWLDGQIRQLKAGTDFQCKPETLVTLARNAAKKAGKVLHSKKVEGGVVLQAVAASEEQLAKWAAEAAEADEEQKAAAKEAAEAEEASRAAGGQPVVEPTAAKPKKSRRNKAS
jgi:hypothetical protein